MRGRRGTLALGLAAALLAALLPAARGQDGDATITAAIEVDRDRLFAGERFDLTLYVQSYGVRLGQEVSLTGLPEHGRLQRVVEFQELPAARRQSGSRIYEVRRFRCMARATSAGALRLAPSLRVTVLTRVNSLFGPRMTESEQSVAVRPLDLVVLPLPDAGKPADFSGAVGQFDFDVTVSPTNVAVGDLVRVRMRVSGTGHLDDIQPPRVAPDSRFKAYDPQPVQAPAAPGREFEQILIPQSAAATAVPEVRFSYFDPKANGGSYRTVSRGPFPLQFHETRVIQKPTYRPDAPAATNGAAAAGTVGPPPLLRMPSLSGTNAALAAAAVRAYEQGYFEAAARGFERVRAGAGDVEVDLNAGLAWVAAGQHGQAMRACWRALNQRPDDPRVAAQIHAVRQATGARLPPLAGAAAWPRRLSPAGWLAMCAGLLLVATAALAARVRFPRLRDAGLLLAGLAAIGLAAGLVAGHTRVAQLREEAVAVAATGARLAPASTAATLFSVAEASVVRVTGRWRGWARIDAGGNRGWVPEATVVGVER